MGKFWFLLTIAFIDLAVALILGARGYGSVAYLFLLIGAILGIYAFVSLPGPQRDARGRLQASEPPYAALLGTVGAIAILGSAAYVAVVSTRAPEPRAAVAPRPVAVRPAAPAAPAYAPPRSFRPSATGAALYKCVDARGHASFQSMPCPAGAEQAWVRDATPEPEPTPAQRRRLQQQRESAARHEAASRGGGYAPGGSSASAASGPSPACVAARNADAAYRRRPLREVTHDGLRWHGDRIREACR